MRAIIKTLTSLVTLVTIVIHSISNKILFAESCVFSSRIRCFFSLFIFIFFGYFVSVEFLLSFVLIRRNTSVTCTNMPGLGTFLDHTDAFDTTGSVWLFVPIGTN